MDPEKWFGGNKVLFYECGEEFFPSLIASIEEASSEILVDIYIFANDKTGTQIRDALAAAAQRGVRVSLVVDSFGCLETPSEFFEVLQKSGVEFYEYNKIRFWKPWQNLFSERLHRKLVVVDKNIGFVGGINFSDEHLLSHPTRPRMDHCIRVEGPVVENIRLVMLQFRARVKRSWRLWGRRVLEKLTESVETETAVLCRFVVRDNLRYRRDIEKHFLKGIQNAKKDILVASAYFFPGRQLVRELRRAAQRGVQVRLILEGRAEFWWLKWATRNLYHRLLKDGVEIYEYQKYILHSKVNVVDSEKVSLGSANLDPLSLFLNLEANLVVSDVNFASCVKAQLESLYKDSRKIELSDIQNATLGEKLGARFFYGLLRLASQTFIRRVQ